jgi:hypothetical protein
MDDRFAAYIGHRGVDLCLKEEDAGRRFSAYIFRV